MGVGCVRSGTFGLDGEQVLRQKSYLPGREGTGWNAPDMADLMVLESRLIGRLAFTFRKREAFSEPFGKAKLGLHLDDQTVFLVFLRTDFVLVPSFVQQPQCRRWNGRTSAC